MIPFDSVVKGQLIKQIEPDQIQSIPPLTPNLRINKGLKKPLILQTIKEDEPNQSQIKTSN